MDLDNDELNKERQRRNFNRYTEYYNEGKDISFDLYKNMYDDLCRYMELYNNVEEENRILNLMISDMAPMLTTPVTDDMWTIKYYREKAIEKINTKDKE